MSLEVKMTLSTLFIESMVISTIAANQVGRMTIPFIRDRIACNPTPSLVVKKTWPNQTSRMKRPEFQSTQTNRDFSMKNRHEEDPPKTNSFKLGEAYLNGTSERPNFDLKGFNAQLKNYMTVYAHNSEPSVKRFNAEHYRIPEPLRATKTAPSSEPSKYSENNFKREMKFYTTKHVNGDVEDTDVTLRPIQGPMKNAITDTGSGGSDWNPTWCSIIDVICEVYALAGPSHSEKTYVDKIFYALYNLGVAAVRERPIYTTELGVSVSSGRIDLEIMGKFLFEFKITIPSPENVRRAKKQLKRYLTTYKANGYPIEKAAVVFLHSSQVRVIEVGLETDEPIRYRPY
jgi:hypothetical protein